jgi:uncharacterized membrane protein YoaK (UPF0700 family)
MTLVTGLVDAFSYLVLGHVFVANMTGNVVFLGFALAGARGFSIAASLVAIVSFVVGAVIGGQLGVRRFNHHKGKLLAGAAILQGVFLAVGLILAAVGHSPPSSAYRYGLILSLAIAMGIQNASVRKLAVADLTTTVLTLTITGIAADSAVFGGKGSKAGRRLVAIAAMMVGALVGASLVIHGHSFYPLLIALILIVAVVGVTRARAFHDGEWARLDP